MKIKLIEIIISLAIVLAFLIVGHTLAMYCVPVETFHAPVVTSEEEKIIISKVTGYIVYKEENDYDRYLITIENNYELGWVTPMWIDDLAWDLQMKLVDEKEMKELEEMCK